MKELTTVAVSKPDDVNVIIGQAHFIKTVEDMYEAMVNAVPGIQFGLAFAEASGACKVRGEGTNVELKKLALDACAAIGAGHVFVVMLKGAYPVNVLNAIKAVPEVCSVFCATANPLEVILAETSLGRGVLGVIDGARPKGIEEQADIAWRHGLLRTIGYKR